MSKCSSPLQTPHTIQLQTSSINHGFLTLRIIYAISLHNAFYCAFLMFGISSCSGFIWLSHNHIPQSTYSVFSFSLPLCIWHFPKRKLNILYGNSYLIYLSYLLHTRKGPTMYNLCFPIYLFSTKLKVCGWMNEQMNKTESKTLVTRS